MSRKALPFDLQGHRGARGLLPENTLAGFARAVELGVSTLETDLAVTRDHVVVLSHDPLLSPAITRDAGGRWLQQPGPPVRTLTLAELKTFDVGRIDPSTAYARQFPGQSPVDGARIPTLDELFAATAAVAKPARYNIEIKTSPDAPADTLDPEAFAGLVVETVRRAGLAPRVTVQSFDWRALLAMRRLAPEIATSGLTIESADMNNIHDNQGGLSSWLDGPLAKEFDGSVPRLVAAAGCRIWSPYWRNLDRNVVDEAHAAGLEVLPWTLNKPADMAAVIEMGVDGLITDYPDRGLEYLAQNNISAR
jgi:glycerophosphoryl diester phosphodiesterase